jgi:hypothetical protein
MPYGWILSRNTARKLHYILDILNAPKINWPFETIFYWIKTPPYIPKNYKEHAYKVFMNEWVHSEELNSTF